MQTNDTDVGQDIDGFNQEIDVEETCKEKYTDSLINT